MADIPRTRLGSTDLTVSRVGFGAWAIGGPAMAGSIAIGWGETDDEVSMQAIRTALDRGITFFDTADFYGLGRSEELIGRVIGNRFDAVVATKVGHRLKNDGSIALDYSREHILAACDDSLRRLQRDHIDLYQLHSARLKHLEAGECIDAMQELTRCGKIRYWGLSLNTYAPQPEADFLMNHELGHACQLVLSVLNQRAIDLMKRAASHGYGVIARMPLQFGLLAGRFDRGSRFGSNDHRSFRLTPPVLEKAADDLNLFFEMAAEMSISPAALALAFTLSHPEVSTVIPGIRTPEQATLNTTGPFRLSEEQVSRLTNLYRDRLRHLLGFMEISES